MDPDKISTASSVGAAERRPLLKALVIERRVLFACTVVIGLCTVVWIVAVCTDQWFLINGGDGILMQQTHRIFFYSGSGLWQTCRKVGVPLNSLAHAQPTSVTSPNDVKTYIKEDNSVYKSEKPDLEKLTLYTKCTNYLLQDNLTIKDPAYDVEVANYSRTMVSFAIISLFVMVMGCGFSAYTFINPRYMFKRLAAGIHFISTSCTMVPTQIITKTVQHFKKNVKVVYPDSAQHSYGISLYLAWCVVLVNLFSALIFLFYSRKRKGNKAATDELAMADEPTIIGR